MFRLNTHERKTAEKSSAFPPQEAGARFLSDRPGAILGRTKGG
jgi:hypothetical protein